MNRRIFIKALYSGAMALMLSGCSTDSPSLETRSGILSCEFIDFDTMYAYAIKDGVVAKDIAIPPGRYYYMDWDYDRTQRI